MPVYDRTVELSESIESILCQTYDAFELILVTDGSPQETMKVVEGYLGEPRVRIIRFEEPSGTAVRGRNAGIAAARGEFIAFQDSDDIADPTRLAESVAQLTESGADIFYGGWQVRLEAMRGDVDFRDNDTILPPLFSVRDLFRNNRVCHGTVTARKSMFLAIGGYKPVMRFREDHELWLRAAYFGYRFVPYAKVMTTIRINNKNNTLNFIGNDPEWYNLMLREYRNAGPAITSAEALS
jgi:glycosyltransferase involved in cell wall biosynthesis